MHSRIDHQPIQTSQSAEQAVEPRSTVIENASEIDDRRDTEELTRTITALEVIESSIVISQEQIAGKDPDTGMRIWVPKAAYRSTDDIARYPIIEDEEGRNRIDELLSNLNKIIIDCQLSYTVFDDNPDKLKAIEELYHLAEFVDTIKSRLQSTLDGLRNDQANKLHEIGQAVVDRASADYYPAQ